MAALPTILHAELDSFYASVEQLLDASVLGRAMALGGGVVVAASYEAKAYGVYGGMLGRRARQLGPSLIFVEGVREEIGLPFSVGAAATKHRAKIASQVAKPGRLDVVGVCARCA